MLDEPEVHLFGSEAQRLGQSLASYSESGRMVIASHSLELASRLVGRCEFLNFTAPGIYELTRPSDWSTSQVEFLAGNGPAGLSGMRVLYVEGVWDQRMVEHLFGDDLRTYQILVSPMHGTVGASACVTSVWQRMIRAPFGVMFDALESSSSLADWASVCERAQTSVRADLVRELRRRAQASALPNEDRALLLLEANLIDANMEDRITFVLHGLSDIFQVLSPRAFGADAGTWSQLGLRKGESFKKFVHRRFSVDLGNGATCEDLFNRLTGGRVAVEPDSYAALASALNGFFHAPARE